MRVCVCLCVSVHVYPFFPPPSRLTCTAVVNELTRHRLSHLHVLSGRQLSISSGGRGEVYLVGLRTAGALFLQLAVLVLPVGAVSHAVLH